MHAERFCEAMAEWMIFEADLWNGDSVPLTRQFFSFLGHCINGLVQQNSFRAPVLSGKAIFGLQRQSKVSSSSARWLYILVLAGGEKSIGKALLLIGFLIFLGDVVSCNLQAVLLGEKLDLHSPPFMASYERCIDR